MYSSVPPPEHNNAPCSTDSEARSACTAGIKGEKHGEASDEKPSRVSCETWQRFQRLKERRQEVFKQYPKLNEGKKAERESRKGVHNNLQSEKNVRSQILRDNKNAWKELCQNIDVNSHLSQDSITKGKPKSKLEEELDKAINEGDFTKAESVSDEIAKQELGMKIVDAIEVRDYKKRKEMEEKSQQAKKKKKLIWGFEQKERWESKGNM